MKRSEHRILTTHAGSLPRPKNLERLLVQRDRGEDVNEADVRNEVGAAIDWVVDKQLDAGIDIGNDGEESKGGYQTYVPQRMSGFGGVSARNTPSDIIRFPKYGEMFTQRTVSTDWERQGGWNAPQAQTAVAYEDDLSDDGEIPMW